MAFPSVDLDGIPAAEHYRQVFRMNGWNTPPEFLDYVHPHWLKYEAPNPFMHQMLGVFYIAFMLISIIGNGTVIYIFSTCKSLRTPGNLFVVTLAVFDFLMMLKTPIFISNSFNEGPLYGKIGCNVFAIMGSLSGIGQSVSNSAIAYERYRTISNPFEGKLTYGKALIIVLGIWLYALVFTVLPALEVWGRFVPEGYLTSCTFDYLTETSGIKAFVGVIFVYAYVIPLWCEMSFERFMSKAKKMNVESLRGNKDLAQQSAEIRIAKVAIGILCLFLLSWTPYAVVALTAAFGNRDLITPLVSMIPALTCKTVACLDPWVYAINHPRYRLELQKKMPWFCIHEPDPPPADNASSVTEKT